MNAKTICSVLSMPALMLVVWMGMAASDRLAAQEDSDSHAAETHADDDSEGHEADHAEGHDGDDSHEAGHGDDAHGGHAETPLLGFDAGSAIVNVLVFLFVFAILSAFVWPNVLGGLKAREDKIRSDLEAAEQANSKANAMLKEYQVKLDDASQQVQAMLAEARHDAEATGRRIVEEAKQEASRQQDRALADIQTAKKVAMSEIAGQASGLAVQLAGSVVGRELKEDDHADLIRQSLERLPSNN